METGPLLDFSCQDPFSGAHNHFDSDESILLYLESNDIFEPCQI